jgi:hypothetical protein
MRKARGLNESSGYDYVCRCRAGHMNMQSTERLKIMHISRCAVHHMHHRGGGFLHHTTGTMQSTGFCAKNSWLKGPGSEEGRNLVAKGTSLTSKLVGGSISAACCSMCMCCTTYSLRSGAHATGGAAEGLMTERQDAATVKLTGNPRKLDLRGRRLLKEDRSLSAMRRCVGTE